MNIEKALDYLYPGTRWVLKGTEYDDLEWHPDNQQKKPTLKQLEKAWSDFEKSGLSYVDDRRKAFQSAENSGELPSGLNDHLDEIYKGFEAILSGEDLPDSLKKIIEKRNNIKATIPKKQP